MAYTPEEIQKINETRESNVNQGISAYSGAGVTPFSASQGLGVINSETLSGNATPVKLPDIPVSTNATELGGYATSVGEQEKERAKLKAEQDAKVQEDTRVANEEKGKIRNLYDQALGIISGRGEAEKAAGLDVKAEKRTEYTNQIEALDRAETNAYRALEGSGLTDVQRAANAREIQRKFAFQKADVALLLSAANRDYETAFNIVNRKIELSLEPIKFQLDYTKTFYEDAKADLTKSEDRAFNLKIAELDRHYEETKILEKYKGDIALEAVKNGVPIPSYVQSEINGAKNQAEVNQVLSRNGISFQNPLDVLQQKATIANLNSQIAERNKKTDPGTGFDAPLYQGLSSSTATAVRQVVGSFKSELQVTNFAAVQDGYNFSQSIADDSKNPADDQALIYSLAKVLDPNSVVREGEYATAQKYAQSWVKAYGKGVTQAIAGTGFLSQEARSNIKKTIETKYKSSKRTYDNVYNEYAGQINNLTGRDDGTKFLRNYSTNQSPPNQSGTLRSPDGTQEVSVLDLTPEQVKEAKDAGWQ